MTTPPHGASDFGKRMDDLRTVMDDQQIRSDEIIAYLQDKISTQELAYHRLEGAITSARRIGAAIGIVMAKLKITEDEAFTILTSISQRQNRKVRLIADDIVLTGTF